MTTLIIDAFNSTIYSDSRRTLKTIDKTWYDNKGEKVFKHNTGKLLAGSCGDLGIAIPELRRLGFIVNTGDCEDKITMKASDYCRIFIINKHNDRILSMQAKKSIITNKVRFEREYITDFNRMWAGSGEPIISSIMEKYPELDKSRMIKYAAMVDKYTDDKVNKVEL